MTNLYNKAYEKFTPDWFENLNKVELYLYENNRSLREFWDQYLEQFFAHKPGPFKVLDLGCGLGGMSIYMAKQGHEVTGIDIADLAIQNARFLAGKNRVEDRVNLKTVDVTTQEMLDEKFDFIFDSHLLHCLTTDAQRSAYYNFVKRHLKDEGHFLLETMSFHKGIRTPIEYHFDENNNLWKQDQEFGELCIRKILPSFDLEQELKANDLNINYLYFHAELTFQVFTEEPDFPIQHLPQTVRVAAKLNTLS